MYKDKLRRSKASKDSSTNREFEKKIIKYGGKAKFWMILEIISFTQLSKFYSNLLEEHVLNMKKKIGTINNIYVLKKNILSIVNLRNICAHHDFLFKNRLTFLPKTFGRKNMQNDSIYCAILNLTYFLNLEENKLLEEDIKQIDLKNYGFPENWSSFVI